MSTTTFFLLKKALSAIILTSICWLLQSLITLDFVFSKTDNKKAKDLKPGRALGQQSSKHPHTLHMKEIHFYILFPRDYVCKLN